MIAEVVLPVPLHKTFDYLIPDRFSNKDPQDFLGRRISVPFGRSSQVGIIRSVKSTSSFPLARLKSFTDFLGTEPILDSFHLELAEWISVRYACSLGDAYFSHLPPHSALKNPPPSRERIHPYATHKRNPDNSVMSRLHEAVYGTGPKQFLLEGRSALERWDIYYSVINDVLSQGKSVLVLLPEIESVNHVSGLLKERFGADAVCAWHSGQKPQDHFDDWWRIKKSEYSIVVGTRTNAMSPMSHEGLIIMDEEESRSYKEERRPRFHARDVVQKRAELSKTVLILGSSCPSMETQFAAQEMKLQHISLTPQNSQTTETQIKIVDMTKEGKRGFLSPVLLEAISARLKVQQKTILFLNRRGFYRSFRCKNCAWCATCPTCSVVLTPTGSLPSPLPKGAGKLKGELWCRLCDFKMPIPNTCPECGEKKLKLAGYGTEKVAEEVHEKFPWCKVARWDSGTVGKGKKSEPPSDFDIIVGTEMVTHGLHLPGVGLVGVIDADVPLRIPDFRASERTFQLLSRMADQTDANVVGAEMIIQSRNIDHYVFECVKNRDPKRFFDSEFKHRSELNYPPSSHLIVVRSDGKSKNPASSQLDFFLKWIAENDADSRIGILGPSPVRTSGKKQQKGDQLLLKVTADEFAEFLKKLADFSDKNASKLWFDVDPETAF